MSSADSAPETTESTELRSFSEQQESSLQDYVETSIMLQYNKH